MRRWCHVLSIGLCLALLVVMAWSPTEVRAASEAQIQELIQELKALKARVAELERKLEAAEARAKRAEAASQEAQKAARQAQSHSVKLSQQVEEVSRQAPAVLSELGKRITIYGAVEVEGSWQRNKPKHGQTSTSSEITLATGEIFFEAQINRYTRGVLHFLWEQGSTEPVDLDEGFILLGQTEDMPFYFLGGRIYPAVGLFDSYLISDPITKNVFETQASAAEVGWAGSWVNVSAGLFNSDVHESGDDPDSQINTYYARVQLESPEGALGEVTLHAGLAYINNIAASNTLRDEVPDQRLSSLVAGLSAMLAVEYKWLAFTGEYITALDDFKAGELSFADDHTARPKAWNLELAFMPIQDWTVAVRYEGSSDLYSLEPERQWGLGVAWDFLPDTTLSLEYMHGVFKNDDERDLITTQLAVGF